MISYNSITDEDVDSDYEDNVEEQDEEVDNDYEDHVEAYELYDEFKKSENFAVLTAEQIQKRIDDAVSSVSSVERDIAILLLIHFNWNVNTVPTDQERIREAIGLLSTSGSPVVSKISTLCIKDYGGPGCLSPDTSSCSAAISSEDMIKSMEDENKYRKYLMTSYVENNKDLKWCPAPDWDCDNAVEYIPGSGIFEVKCSCSYSFCWNCLEEIHRPVDCETVSKWKYKCRNEGIKKILPDSKPCPECKKPVEKNQGCMRAICRAYPCLHEFCWLCLDPWEKHRSGLYSCYNEFSRFFERWAANEATRRKSALYLEELKSGKLKQTNDIQQVSVTDFNHMINTWEQIVECTRVLKWAYVYGYYIPVEEKSKKHFFEFVQGEAEACLERLHECAEQVMQYAVDANGPLPNFKSLETKLQRSTRVTRNYFDQFVRALENGLGDVGSRRH